MKTRFSHGLSTAAISVLFALMSVFTAFAANVAGSVESVSASTISGWAIDKDNPDKSASVVLYAYVDGSTKATELAKVTADQYRSDLVKTLGDGNHSFSYRVNWNDFQGSQFIVEAYIISGEEQIRLDGSLQYSKKDSAVKGSESVKASSSGPASDILASDTKEETAAVKGNYLGQFTTTAYCNCDICSSGHNLTYSGTVPRSKHTISADINYYPIGTKLMIGDIVYTVEDIGSGVNGNNLDIFFDTHEEALNYGRKTVDVYLAS